LIKATASISSNLDKAFTFSTNHGKPLISVLLLNKPLVWIVLSKSGASDTGERATVMEIFLDLFGAQNFACLLGDREFVGRDENKIQFSPKNNGLDTLRNGETGERASRKWEYSGQISLKRQERSG
jgi:hypothetical protein